MKHELINAEILSRILKIRGQKVILDKDLAELYEVPVKRLNEQMKRNIERFPEDFMFQLNNQEFATLRSQFATTNRGGSRYRPYVFTEHGALMAASVLNSEKAVKMSIAVIRVFVKMREILAENKDFSGKLNKLETRMDKTDKNVEVIFTTLRQLREPLEAPQKKKIGFVGKKL